MRWRWLTAASLLVLVLASCAHQPPPGGSAPLPGFFLGLLHGYISLFSLIASLFFEVRIYDYPNNGFFYDLGFVIGVFAFYGSGRTTYVYVRRPR